MVDITANKSTTTAAEEEEEEEEQEEEEEEEEGDGATFKMASPLRVFADITFLVSVAAFLLWNSPATTEKPHQKKEIRRPFFNSIQSPKRLEQRW